MTLIGAAKRGHPVELSDAEEDMRSGQLIIVSARWILVAAGMLLALWLPGGINELRIQILVLIGLAIANFFLHAQLLRQRPAIDVIAYAASAADIGVITLLIGSQGGFRSDLYIFYFPALLALSLAFPTEIAFGFGGLSVVLYGLMAGATAFTSDTEVIVARLLMLAAVVVCGNMYRRIEHDRRTAAAEAQAQLAADVKSR